MAQHIPIQAMTRTIFLKIEKAIRKDFTNPYIGGSLKYEKLDRVMGKDALKNYQTDQNDEIYLTDRYIGEGIIWGSNHGSFEIHFDKAKKQVSEIYLVA